ncbi:MAG: putative S-layer protein [Candidatus Pacearchaeota archaeon]
MKDKKSLLFVAGLLTFVFLVGFASASIGVSQNSLTFTDSTLKSLTVSTTNLSSITLTYPSQITIGTGTQTFTFNVVLNPTTINSTSSGALTITPAIGFDINKLNFLSSVSGSFNISGDSDTETINIVVENNQFCSEETSSNVDITIDSINTKSGFGSDEDYWYSFDNVDIDFVVEYNGGSKDEFQDGQLDWALYNKAGDLITDGDENIKDLEDGDEETITISFQLDTNDLDVDTEDYILYVSATGNENLDSGTDKDICSSDSQDIEIRMDDNFVVLDNIKFLPDPASCGSEVEITADVWNIGVDDQDDISVRIFIDELKINQLVDIGSIDSFDKESLDLKINLPKDAQEKTYPVKLWVYDADNDVYQNSEDDMSKFELPLSISGSCSTQPQVTVLASLESGGQTGKPLTVKATITNAGESLETFNINVAGYNSFASSATLDQSTVAIASGASKDVLITLNINKNVLGEQSFNIEVSSDGKTIITQPVQVTITAPTGLGGITGGIINEGNWYLWGIGVLNVILVIIIIIVAIRIARS